jgi:hypothetical protein
VHKIFEMPFSRIYPLYVTKLERKGRSEAELREVIAWLTGFDDAALTVYLADDVSNREFFAQAQINPRAELITGKICGVTIQDIDDPLMKQIRYLDKLVDDLYRGRPMEKVLR